MRHRPVGQAEHRWAVGAAAITGARRRRQRSWRPWAPPRPVAAAAANRCRPAACLLVFDGAMRCLLQVLATMSVAGIDVGDSTSCIALARKGGAQNSGCAWFASGLARISLRVSLVGAAYLQSSCRRRQGHGSCDSCCYSWPGIGKQLQLWKQAPGALQPVRLPSGPLWHALEMVLASCSLRRFSLPAAWLNLKLHCPRCPSRLCPRRRGCAAEQGEQARDALRHLLHLQDAPHGHRRGCAWEQSVRVG